MNTSYQEIVRNVEKSYFTVASKLGTEQKSSNGNVYHVHQKIKTPKRCSSETARFVEKG